MADVMLIDEKSLVCGMCGRRICDIAIIRGDVYLLQVSRGVGIPLRMPRGRAHVVAGAQLGETPRNPNVRMFEDDSADRTVSGLCMNTNPRAAAHLDRTVTATTLETLYADAVAADEREVVLR